MIYPKGKYSTAQLSLAKYHNEVEAVSKTNLDHINVSYAHYLYNKEHPVMSALSGPIPKCLVEGSALHCLVLTPEEFTKEFKILPVGLNRRTREGKALYQQILSQGVPVLSAPVFTRLEAMAGAILNHPSASALLKNGAPESSYIWTDPDTGVTCKCRPDYLSRLMIPDIKSCQDASYEAFQRAIIDHRYHVQGAYFVDGVKAVDGQRRDFVLIAVEKEAPFAVAVYKLDEETLEQGRLEYKRNLQTYKTYQEHPERWTGYESMVMTMNLPKWARRNPPDIKSVGVETLL